MSSDSRQVTDLPDDRLFPLTGYGDEFVIGICADGRQVVMGLLCPHVVAYFFDPDGRLLGDEHRPWDHPAPRLGGTGPYDIYDRAFAAALARQLHEWQRALGFRPGPIRVRAFFDPRHPVGIELMPGHLVPDEDDWAEMDAEERRQVEQDQADWRDSGQFVWWWAKDYWTDPDGRVVST